MIFFGSMGKVLSVIVPLYNMEKYLHRCLDSLILEDKDKFYSLEVLVINDGSKDASSLMAHEYQDRYPFVYRVIDKENGNYGSCINRGLKEASGKYVKVLDADDWFDKKELSSFICFLNKSNSDLVISDYCCVNSEGGILGDYTFPLPIGSEFGLNTLNDGTIKWLWHQGVTYKLDVFSELGYHQTEGISYTDDEWIYKPIINIRSISYYPHILYWYLRGREGQTFDPKVLYRSYKNRVVVALELIDFYGKHKETCSHSVNRYMTLKLYDRLLPIYNHYLFVVDEFDGYESLRDIDEKLKVNAKSVYDMLGDVHNRIGLHFIRIWRKSNYNQNNPLLKVIRIKNNLSRKITSSPNVPLMPSNLKRLDK